MLKHWPTHGAIKFSNVNLSYDGETQILKNLSFEIQPKEKIGIVGLVNLSLTIILQHKVVILIKIPLK